MMKIKIEGLDIHYKNVADLDTKVHEQLTAVRLTKLQAAVELKGLIRRERALMKFLGVQNQEKHLEMAKSPFKEED